MKNKTKQPNREACSVKMEAGEPIHVFLARIFLGILLRMCNISPYFASWGHSCKNNTYIAGHRFYLPLRTLHFKENSCANASTQRQTFCQKSSHTVETALLVIFLTYMPNRERGIISSCCQRQPKVREHSATKKWKSFQSQQIMMDPQLFGEIQLFGYPRTRDMLFKAPH